MASLPIDLINDWFYRLFPFASCSVCARMRPSCALSSGVNSAPKSSASNIWRISTSASSLWGLGQRFNHSIASSFDLHCQIQNPAISSFVSANGPSITVRLFPENLTRVPLELCCNPSPEHYPGFPQLFVELTHFGQELLALHHACFRVPVGFNQDHES